MKFFIINLSRDGFTMALAVVPGRELAHERAFKEKMTDLGLIEDKHYSKSKYCVYTYEVEGIVNTINILMTVPQEMILSCLYARQDGRPIIYRNVGARYATLMTALEFGSENTAILDLIDNFMFSHLSNYIQEFICKPFWDAPSVVQLRKDMLYIEKMMDCDFFIKPRYLLAYSCLYHACLTENNQKSIKKIALLSMFRQSPLLRTMNDMMNTFKEELAPCLKDRNHEEFLELYYRNLSGTRMKKAFSI